MKKNSRLIGIDLFRGIAAYAVVVQHSAIAPVSTLASHFQDICGFAVPFFLATSFLFIARKNLESVDLFNFLGERTRRILIPYAAWTALYLALKLPVFLGVNHRFGHSGGTACLLSKV